MTTTITRIVTALTGPAVAAGILAGGLALSAPAQAQAQAQPSSMTTTCATAPVRGMAPSMLNPLTRPAQVAAYESASMPNPAATSCIGQ